MIQIYVTRMPKTKEDCPFWDTSENHCNINNGACCLADKDRCGHLIDFCFDFIEEVNDDEES